ncbi:MAG: carbohydrate binding family 9 domain-containing protein, partial [Gemmatimonadales bacterium]
MLTLLVVAPLLGRQPAAAQDPRPTLRAGTGAETVVLDGRLDEPGWAAAPAIAGLSQVEPQERGTASAVTTIRVLVDPRVLVFGIDARRGPAPLTAFARGRDADLDDEDHILLVLDPFGDGRSGYRFAVNPNGARFDALITNQGEGENDDWDAVWEAATTVGDSGWTAEIRIPVKSLTFPPGADQWAMNLERRIQAALETDRWASPTRDRKIGQTAGAGWLTGLPRFDLGLGLTFRPSLVTGGGHPEPHTELDGEFNLSLDVEKRIGAALLGSATVNTDFAETEADTRRSN